MQDIKSKLESLSKYIIETQESRKQNKLKLLKADVNSEDLMQYCDEMDSRITNLANMFYDTMGAVMDHVNEKHTQMHQKMDNHMNAGHLPPLTPSQVNAVLKLVKADGDYTVVPKPIYAQKNKVLEVGISK